MDVYQIGISITMQNGVSAVIGLIQKQMLGLNAATTQAAAGFGKLKWAIAGATGIFLGVEMLKGLGDLTKHGEKYTHQLELMKTAGMQVAEMQSAINAANKVSSTVMSTTPAENLQTISELRTALASADVRPGGKADPAMATHEAVAHLETFQKITGIMSSLLSKDGKPFDGSGQAYELAKAAEMLGLSQNPKKFDQVLEGWTQAIISQGGKLQGSDIFGNVKYLRGAGLGMDMEFLTEILPSLAGEMKTGKGAGSGGGAGNPLMSMFSAIVGGTLSNKAVTALQQLHLLDMSKVQFTKTGRVKEVDPGAVIGSDVMVHNPFKFVTDYLEPSMKKFTKFLDKTESGEFKKPGELFGFLAHVMGNRTAQQVMSMMLLQQSRIAGDVGLKRASLTSVPAYAELARRDPVLVMEELNKQVERFQTDIGKMFTPMKTEFIYQLANAVRYLSEAIENNPRAAKAILAIFTGLAGVLIVLGTIALAGAALSALVSSGPLLLVVAGISALSVALTMLNDKFDLVGKLARAFDTVFDPAFLQAIIGSLGQSVKGLWAMVGETARGVINFSETLITNLKTSIWNIWTALTDGLANLIQNIKAWFASLPSRIMAAVTGAVMPTATAAPGSAAPAVGTGIPTMTIRPPMPAGPDSKGTSGNPLVVHVQNQTSGRDILNGATGGMARQAARPSSGVPWTNTLAMPQLTPTPF